MLVDGDYSRHWVCVALGYGSGNKDWLRPDSDVKRDDTWRHLVGITGGITVGLVSLGFASSYARERYTLWEGGDLIVDSS